MQRLFGTHNRGRNVAKITGSTSGEEKPGLCSKLSVGLRLALLIAASVTAGMVSKAAKAWETGHGACMASASVAVYAADAPATQLDVALGSPALCAAPYWTGIVVALFAAALAVVCSINLKTGRVIAQPGIMPKVEMLLKVLALAAMIVVTAIAFARERDVCSVGHAVGSPSATTCAAQLASINHESCPHCEDGMFDGVYAGLAQAQHLGLVQCTLWALLVVIAAVRHWRAAQREAALAVARALDEAEMKEEFARRKAEEEKTKAEGKGEGKGAVYRLLM